MQDPIRFSNPFAFEIKDTANTAILRWAGKTLALYEVG
jgi:carotenoid cleavage dioxygenase-like enzyme